MTKAGVPQFYGVQVNAAGTPMLRVHQRQPVIEKIIKYNIAELGQADLICLCECGPELLDCIVPEGFEVAVGGGMLIDHAAKQRGEDNDTLPNPILFRTSKFELLDVESFGLSPDRAFERAWDGVVARGATCGRLRERVLGYEVLTGSFQFDNIGREARRQSAIILHEGVERVRGDREIGVLLLGDSNVNVGSPHPTWFEEDMREPYDYLIRRYQNAWFSTDQWEYRLQNRPLPASFHGYQGMDGPPDKYGTHHPVLGLVNDKLRVDNAVLIRDSYGGVQLADHWPLGVHCSALVEK